MQLDCGKATGPTASMVLAIAVILGTITAGLGLAFLPGLGARALGAVRSFALSAALTVVLLHLLPDAIEAVGVRALLAMVLGMALPIGVERALARRAAAEGAQLAFEVGFVGLLAHQIGDGLALWSLARGEGNVGGVLAIGAHIMPVTTVLVLRDVAARGTRRALLRAAALAAATIAGLLAGEVVPPALIAPVLPWVTALASGLLLHVVAHEVTGPAPHGALDRTLDLAAVLAGASLSIGGALMHGDALLGAFAVAFVAVTRAVSLPLLVGAIGALVQEAGTRAAWVGRVGAWISAGLVLGAFALVVLPPGPLEGPGRVLALIVLVALGYGSALAAAPLAVVLVAHMAPSWVFGAMVLGPLMTARASRPGIGKLGVWAEIGGALLAVAGAHAMTTPLAEAGISGVAAVLLGVALVVGVWHAGLRGWLARLGIHAHGVEAESPRG